jgi:hypothetical protein
VNLDSIRPRIPNFTQKSKMERFKKTARTNEPSPHSYSPDDRQNSKRVNSPNLLFGKAPMVTYMQRHIKNKSYMPSSAHY